MKITLDFFSIRQHSSYQPFMILPIIETRYNKVRNGMVRGIVETYTHPHIELKSVRELDVPVECGLIILDFVSSSFVQN